MLGKIAQIFELKLSRRVLSTLVWAFLGPASATLLGRAFVSGLLKFSGAGAIAGAGLSAATAGSLTMALGELFLKSIIRVKLRGVVPDSRNLQTAFVELLAANPSDEMCGQIQEILKEDHDQYLAADPSTQDFGRAAIDLCQPGVFRSVVELLMAVILADGLIKQIELTALNSYFERTYSLGEESRLELTSYISNAEESDLSGPPDELLAFFKDFPSENKEDLYSVCVELAYADNDLVIEEQEVLSNVARAFGVSVDFQNHQINLQGNLSEVRQQEQEERRQGRYTVEDKIQFRGPEG